MYQQEKKQTRSTLVRRSCARLIDCSIALIIWLTFDILFLGSRANKNLAMVFIDQWIAVCIACVGEIFLIAWTGTTIGKRIFGIFVLKRDRVRLSITESFVRTYSVWHLAFGYGIPFVRIVYLVRIWHGIGQGVALSWDDESDWVVEFQGAKRAGGYFTVLSVLMAGLFIWLYF
ncbi:MAG TPA: RDD family protein [Clostridiaceae bacterium]|nr:RDD family protein [Clostridiaceae bacterium]